MSGNVSTDYLAAIQAYLEGPVVDDRDAELGQRQARMQAAAASLARVVKDPGAAWLEIDAFRSMAASHRQQNDRLMQSIKPNGAQS